MDAGNMLKPMLARGELHMIGATTLTEYRKRVEKDAALERRFQQVMVDEPRVEDTISILRGLRERLEIFHGVKIQDTALVAAATLSHRYISDRFLPDKAIDLVDEACARLRTEIDSMPAELDELTRRVTRLEIEEGPCPRRRDPASAARLEELRRELADLRGEADAETGPVGGRTAGDPPGAGAASGTGAGPPGGGGGRARLRPEPGRRTALRAARRTGARARRRGGAARRQAGQTPAAARGGHRGGDRRDRRRLDRHPRHPAPGGRTARNCCAWTRSCASASSARTRPSGWSPTRSSAPGPASATRGVRSARSSSSAPPASGRPSWPRRLPRRCSTPRRTWSGST